MSNINDLVNDDNAMERLLADVMADPLEIQWAQPAVEPDNRRPWTQL